MTRVQNTLMALIGTAGSAVYFWALFQSSVLGELASLPILLMIAVVGASLCALPLGLTPVFALIASGGSKAKKPKKSKKDKAPAAASASSSASEADASMLIDDFDASTSELSTVGDIEYSDAFDSNISSDIGSDLQPRSDVTDSGVADLLDSSSTSSDEEDPFDISDSFESDITDVEGTMNDGSESFDDQFELSPDSGVDFEADDDEKR